MKRDPYKYFRIEAKELLEQLHKGVLDLESGTPVDFAALLRAAHTLKGAARIVKQKGIADLAHALEDRLGPYRDGGRPSADDLRGALESLDGIATELGRLPAAESDEKPGAPAPPAQQKTRTIRVDVDEVDALLGSLEAVQAELAATRAAAANTERVRRLALRLSTELSPVRGAELRTADASAGFARARSAALEVLDVASDVERRMERGVARLNAGVAELRERAEGLRLVSVDTLGVALQRLARDTASGIGKRVTFSFRAAAIRLDGDVLDGVQAALVQAVINAIAHGIEPESERRERGKPPEGSIVVEVKQSGSDVVFQCADDGRGVDVDAVRRAMQQKAPAGQLPHEMDDAAVLQSMLRAGVSTASRVTGYAGRGVGLGVMQEAADRLRGTASISTTRGAGTTVAIHVPASLIGVVALVLECETQVAAIPVDSVRGVRRVAPGELTGGEQDYTMTIDEESVRVVPIARILRQHVPDFDSVAATGASAVLIGDGAARIGLLVDRVAGTQVIVHRPLPAFATADAVISGVYIDADGVPRPMLDANACASATVLPSSRHATPAAAAPKPILIVDDSLTTRMLERTILESAGYEVALATSGEEGLAMARAGDYGLILVDVEMPGMDGFTFVAHCQTDPTLQAIPCVLVTSLDAPEHRARGMAAGAKAYVVKTLFDQSDFLNRVRELIRR